MRLIGKVVAGQPISWLSGLDGRTGSSSGSCLSRIKEGQAGCSVPEGQRFRALGSFKRVVVSPWWLSLLLLWPSPALAIAHWYCREYQYRREGPWSLSLASQPKGALLPSLPERPPSSQRYFYPGALGLVSPVLSVSCPAPNSTNAMMELSHVCAVRY
jgi:hypothetical protein